MHHINFVDGWKGQRLPSPAALWKTRSGPHLGGKRVLPVQRSLASVCLLQLTNDRFVALFLTDDGAVHRCCCYILGNYFIVGEGL